MSILHAVHEIKLVVLYTMEPLPVYVVYLYLLIQKNQCPVNQLLQYMIDVAMGMHYLAEKRFVHRVSKT